MRGSPLNDRGLADRLKQYGIKSCDVKINGVNLKGYTLKYFYEAWDATSPFLPETALPPLPALPMGRASCDDDDAPPYDNDPFESLKL